MPSPTITVQESDLKSSGGGMYPSVDIEVCCSEMASAFSAKVEDYTGPFYIMNGSVHLMGSGLPEPNFCPWCGKGIDWPDSG